MKTFSEWLDEKAKAAYDECDLDPFYSWSTREKFGAVGKAYRTAQREYDARQKAQQEAKEKLAALQKFDVIKGHTRLTESPFGKVTHDGLLWDKAVEIAGLMITDYPDASAWKEVTEARALPAMSYRLWVNRMEGVWIMIRNSDCDTFVPEPLLNLIQTSVREHLKD